jgi:hypothetical protein
MAQNSDAGREPLREADVFPDQPLSSRISNLTDLDVNFYDPPSPSLRPRESLVSLDSTKATVEDDATDGNSYPGARPWNSSQILNRSPSYMPLGGKIPRGPSSR